MIKIRPGRQLTIRPGGFENRKYAAHAIAKYRGTRAMPPKRRDGVRFIITL